MLELFLKIFFPLKCIGCNTENQLICDKCQQNVIYKPTMHTINGLILYTACQKSPILRKIVHQYKYSFKTVYKKYLGELLYNCLDELLNDKSNIIFVPIPLYWYKKSNRGYNQSELLARILSKKLKSQSIKLLIRKKNTKPQAQLKKNERIKNLNKAFQINKNININKLLNHKIIIVDDIYTTGETMTAAFETLKNNEFKDIRGLAISRGL